MFVSTVFRYLRNGAVFDKAELRSLFYDLACGRWPFVIVCAGDDHLAYRDLSFYGFAAGFEVHGGRDAFDIALSNVFCFIQSGCKNLRFLFLLVDLDPAFDLVIDHGLDIILCIMAKYGHDNGNYIEHVLFVICDRCAVIFIFMASFV